MEHRFDLPYGEKQRLKIMLSDVEYRFLDSALMVPQGRGKFEEMLISHLGFYYSQLSSARGFKKYIIEQAMTMALIEKYQAE